VSAMCHDARVLRRRARIVLVAALGLALAAPAGARADTIAASVGSSASSQQMAPGFVGVSFEYRAVRQYTGSNAHAIDPPLLGLLAGIAPGQSPVIRIGGDSTDDSWWPMRRVHVPGGINYAISRGWLRTTAALASDLKARLILGINLAAGRTTLATAEARALLSAIGRRRIDALEIGNEPDLYGVFPWYRSRRGKVFRARAHGYDLAAYTKQFTQWAQALPRIPLAGPATSGPAWMSGLGRFIAAEPRLGIVTYHRYPLRECVLDPHSNQFPSIPHLLSDAASAGLAGPLARYVTLAHRHGLPFRVDELNSASCEGAPGVSDTFASALWALDTLFNLASVGVDGVNFHMLPGSAYQLFSVSQTAAGTWQAVVHPEYYAVLMFEQAFPPDASLLPVSAAGGPVKIWATVASDGTIHVVVINKDTTAEHTVRLTTPTPATQATVETLTAPSASSTSGVTLGGQTFDPFTTTGTLPAAPATSTVSATGGGFTLDVPAASAELLTVAG
jgi:Glycosyl hydrolase family 79 C-terminal beta domain